MHADSSVFHVVHDGDVSVAGILVRPFCYGLLEETIEPQNLWQRSQDMGLCKFLGAFPSLVTLGYFAKPVSDQPHIKPSDLLE